MLKSLFAMIPFFLIACETTTTNPSQSSNTNTLGTQSLTQKIRLEYATTTDSVRIIIEKPSSTSNDTLFNSTLPALNTLDIPSIPENAWIHISDLSGKWAAIGNNQSRLFNLSSIQVAPSDSILKEYNLPKSFRRGLPTTSIPTLLGQFIVANHAWTIEFIDPYLSAPSHLYLKKNALNIPQSIWADFNNHFSISFSAKTDIDSQQTLVDLGNLGNLKVKSSGLYWNENKLGSQDTLIKPWIKNVWYWVEIKKNNSSLEIWVDHNKIFESLNTTVPNFVSFGGNLPLHLDYLRIQPFTQTQNPVLFQKSSPDSLAYFDADFDNCTASNQYCQVNSWIQFDLNLPVGSTLVKDTLKPAISNTQTAILDGLLDDIEIDTNNSLISLNQEISFFQNPKTLQNNKRVLLHFKSLNIPSNSKILSAQVLFTPAQSNSTPTLAKIGLPSDYFNWNDSLLVSQIQFKLPQVNWSIGAWDIAQPELNTQSANISDLIEGARQWSRWSESQEIILSFEGGGSRSAYAYENSPTRAPKLKITWQSNP